MAVLNSKQKTPESHMQLIGIVQLNLLSPVSFRIVKYFEHQILKFHVNLRQRREDNTLVLDRILSLKPV